MLVPSVWLMLLMADCSTAAQDCPAGQMCTATGVAEGCAERGQCEPLPAAAELELSLPVPKGERVFCGNGNLRPGHYRVGACWPEQRFSVDLASTAFEAPHVVVAKLAQQLPNRRELRFSPVPLSAKSQDLSDGDHRDQRPLGTLS